MKLPQIRERVEKSGFRRLFVIMTSPLHCEEDGNKVVVGGREAIISVGRSA